MSNFPEDLLNLVANNFPPLFFTHILRSAATMYHDFWNWEKGHETDDKSTGERFNFRVAKMVIYMIGDFRSDLRTIHIKVFEALLTNLKNAFICHNPHFEIEYEYNIEQDCPVR